MGYAVIKNGIISNIITLNDKNSADFPSAVPLRGEGAGIGDEYREGSFYREGKELLSPLEAALRENEEMREALRLLGVEK